MVISSAFRFNEPNHPYREGDLVKVGQEQGVVKSLSENPDLVRVEFTTGPQSGNIRLVVASQCSLVR
jgi:hypothetical protein